MEHYYYVTYKQYQKYTIQTNVNLEKNFQIGIIVYNNIFVIGTGNKKRQDKDKDNDTSENAGSHISRDIDLMISTLTVLIYMMLLLGLLMWIPSLLAPWLLIQAACLARMLYMVIFTKNDEVRRDIVFLALYFNNWVQVFCVFLGMVFKK